MRAAAIFSAMLLLAGVKSEACDWYSEEKKVTLKDVRYATREELLHHESREVWQKRVDKLRPLMAGLPTVLERSDYAGALLHVGQYNEARRVLELAEAMTPGRYEVAANLGTAFELLDRNQLAYNWIVQGIRRNPDSHYGTEWLHVRILEVKLELAKDPDWLKSNPMLKGMDYGQDARPLDDGSKDRAGIVKALFYQLHERLQFVPAPDTIVGELLFNLGDELVLAKAYQNAVGIYELAAT